MRPVAEHRAAAVGLAPAPRPETLELAEARGRVLLDAVTSTVDVPVFDNSAMDGYAVRAAEALAGAALPVVLDVPAGAAPGVLPPGCAARIMTGAPVPDGADAVVPRELTDDGLDLVTLQAMPARGAHIRRVAEDARRGDVIVAPGTVLGPAALAAAAGAGVASVTVAARPRVLVVSTGDELRAPGDALAPGQIYDSNSTLMAALVASAGGVAARSVRTGDDPADLLDVLAELSGIELVLTAGGVSVGAYDVVKEALAARGVEFSAVAMQPGKPQGLGSLDGVAVACLPGNPVSVAASFCAFVEPLLRAAQGLAPRSPELARVDDAWLSPSGREQWVPVTVEPSSDGLAVRRATAGGSRSHLGLSLARAEAWAIVAAEVEAVEPGDTVGLMRFLP